MMAGCYPFAKSSDPEKTKNDIKLLGPRIAASEVNWSYLPASTSEDCKDLLSKLITKEPSDRLTTKQVLQHPWFHPIRDEVAVVFNDTVLQRNRV